MIEPFDTAKINALVDAVQQSLTDDLLDAKQRRLRAQSSFIVNTTGHCSVAAEAVYHMLGGKAAGYTPCVMRPVPGLDQTHWFIIHKESGIIVDPTVTQFRTTPDYGLARGCGFPTRKMGAATVGPSKRAAIVIKRANRLLEEKLLTA